MPADEIRVDYAGLVTARQQLLAEYDAVVQQGRRVRWQLDVLRAGAWQGPAADAFALHMISDVLPAMERLADALALAAAFTEDAARIMDEAEDAGARAIMGVQGAAWQRGER